MTAVLENWQDVENAIDIYANSAGSAMRENEIYLDSWEAKSKALTASWNELVNTFLNADMFKGFIEGATKVIKFLTDINAIVPILIGLLAGGLYKSIFSIIGAIKAFTVALAEAGMVAALSTGGLSVLVGAIVAVAGGLVAWGVSATDTEKQLGKLNTKIQEQQTEIDKLTSKEKDVVELYKEYESLMSKSQAYGLNASEKENLLKISKELVNTYGLETSGIDTLTGAYIVGANAVNQYVEALRDERLEKEREQTGTRNERIKKNIDTIKKDDRDLVDNVTANKASNSYLGAHSYNVDLNEQYGGEFFDVDKDRESNDIRATIKKRFEENSQYAEEEIEEILNSQEVKDYIEAVQTHKAAWDTQATIVASKRQVAINAVVNDVLKNIQVDSADMLDSNGESFLTQMLTPYFTTVDWSKFNRADFEAKVKSFVEGASGTIAEVSAKLKDSQGKMMSGDMNFTGYTDMYGTLQNQAGLAKQMFDQGIIDQESYKQQTSQIYSQIANNIGLSMVEISGHIKDTDEKSKKNFQNVADNLIALENQFKKGSISSTEYISSLTKTIEGMDFTQVFGENKEAAQQFFSTLANKSANILQDTITQFKAGKMSVKDYGNNLKDFAKQQKELANNAIQEAKAMGMSEEQVKKLSEAYEESGEKIDEAVKQWEELEGINTYLDENIETLRTTTDVASASYQSFASGLYSEFTQLSDSMQAKIIADMQKMDGLGKITAENLQSEMSKSTAASAGLADAIAGRTNSVFQNLANNGGKVLTALGNAIKGFNYNINFNPKVKGYSEESVSIADDDTVGGKVVNKLIKFKLPIIDYDITGAAGDGAEGLGDALSSFGSSLSTASDFLTTSDYGSKTSDSSSGSRKDKPADDAKNKAKDKSADDAKKKAEEEEKKRIAAYKESLSARMGVLDRYQDHMDTVDFGLNLINEHDFDNQTNLLNLKLEEATQYGKELREEFDRASATIPETGEELEALASHLSSLGNKMRDNVAKIREMQVALEKAKISSIATRSQGYVDELQRELSSIERRMQILKSDNKEDYEYTNKVLNMQSLLPNRSSIDRTIRSRGTEDRDIIRAEQETQDALDEILRKQIEKNENLREEERTKIIENLTELQSFTQTKITEAQTAYEEALAQNEVSTADSCNAVETLIDATNMEFPEPSIDFSKAEKQFDDFGAVVDRLDSKAQALAKDLGLLASTTGIDTPGVMPGKTYASGTPGGNAKAKDLGIAGENYKSEILIDKATGKTTIIDSPTIIDTTKTDVVGENVTARLSRFANGTFGSDEEAVLAIKARNARKADSDFTEDAMLGYNESKIPDNSSYEKKYHEYEKKIEEWIEQFDVAGYPFDEIYPVVSKFGMRLHPIKKKMIHHNGVDIDAPGGTTIRSVSAGTVTLAGWNGGYGNCVMIQDAKGVVWLYGHMSQQPSVVAGQQVTKGQAIGLVGSTGLSTGPHLHLERRVGGVGTDPLHYLKYYASGTPTGNMLATRLGVAGENNKPEILVDKKSGEMQYIDSPTLIDTTKTDVVGERATSRIPKFADGTVDPADIARYIREKYPEITDAGIAGILGNIKYESAFNPKAYNAAEKRSGLVQTDNTRISNWSNIVDSGTWQEQIDAVIYEGRYLNSGMGSNSAYNVWEKVLTNTALSASQAAKDFDILWERSDGTQRNNRAQAAEDYYKQLSTWLTTDSPEKTVGENESELVPEIKEINEVMTHFSDVYDKAYNKSMAKELSLSERSMQTTDDDEEYEIAKELYKTKKEFVDEVKPEMFNAYQTLVKQYLDYLANGGNDQEIIEEYLSRIEEMGAWLQDIEDDVVDRRNAVVDFVDAKLENIDKIIDEHDFYETWSKSEKSKLRYLEDYEKIIEKAYADGIISEAERNSRIEENDRRRYDEAKTQLFDAVEKIITDKEKEVEKEQEKLSLKSSKYDSLKTLLQSYHGVVNAISAAQKELDKDLATSMAMIEYLDEDTRKLLFNQDDYDALTEELQSIQREADKLQKDYQRAVRTASEETLPKITSQYQMQYDMLMKSYEISKADLEVAKKKQQLNNALNERNVRMFIDGRWQWVSDTNAVAKAQNELADAESASSQALTGMNQQKELNKLQTSQDDVNLEIANLNKELEDYREKWSLIQEELVGEQTQLYSILNDMVNSDMPMLRTIVSTVGTELANLVTDITGEEFTLPEEYSESEDYMSKALGASSLEEALGHNSKRNSKIDRAAPGESGYGQVMYSDDEMAYLWENLSPGWRFLNGLESTDYFDIKGFSKNGNAKYKPLLFENMMKDSMSDEIKKVNQFKTWNMHNLLKGVPFPQPSTATNNTTNINIDGLHIDGNKGDGKAFADALNRLMPIYS